MVLDGQCRNFVALITISSDSDIIYYPPDLYRSIILELRSCPILLLLSLCLLNDISYKKGHLLSSNCNKN